MTRTSKFSAAVMLLGALWAAPARGQEAVTSDRSEAGWHFLWRDHPEVAWGDLLRLSFRGSLQADGRRSESAVERDGDTFDVGRRRLGVHGKVGRRLGFEVERELESAAPWRDVAISYHVARSVEIHAGRFKLPFGLEETTGGTDLNFLYRSNVSRRLAPGRDPGVMAEGRLAGKTIGYEAGVFAHDGNNARSRATTRVFGGRTIASRITVEPFRKSRRALGALELGAAITTSPLAEGFPSIRGRSLFGMSFFDADVWVRGSRRRAGLQAQWQRGPLWMASEYIRVSDDRTFQSSANTDLPDLVAHGWYVGGAWTARMRAAGSIRSAVRFERLAFGDAAATRSASTAPRAAVVLGSRAEALTLGVTWRPNRWASVEANLVREDIGETSALSPRVRVLSHIVRLQLSM